MTSHESSIGKTQSDVGNSIEFALARDSMADHLILECDAMMKYGLSNGLEISHSDAGSFEKLQADRAAIEPDQLVRQLAAIHKSLAKSVYPATPRSIVLLSQEQARAPLFYFLGPVPLVRRLSAIAIFFLCVLIVVSLNKDVNVDNINLGLLNGNNNILFVNQVFLLSCAGLGASFAALFKANGFIANATYSPRYDSSYWSRIILGLIAGIILVELLPSSLFSEGSMRSFGKPALAMLGGFSANVVYRVLQRLVESLETLVKGSGISRNEQQQALIHVKASEQRTELSASTANKLVGLLKDLDGLDGAEVKSRISGFVEELLPSDKRG